MAKKEWAVAFGQRDTGGSSDPIGDIVRRNMAEREEKKEERKDELEELQHEAKVKDLKGEGKAESPIQIKPVEIDVQRGERDAIARAEKAEEQAAKEREGRLQSDKELEKERITNLEKTFTAKLDEVAKLLADSTSDKGSISDKLAEAEVVASKLGWGPKGDAGIPGSIQLQITQMNNDLKLRVEQMVDERDQRSKEWQLTLKKWDDEKATRQQEMAMKAAADTERTNLMRGAINTIGRVAGKSMVEEGATATGRPSAQAPQQYQLEADVGEEGTFDCPSCHRPLFLAPDAARVVCGNCGATSLFRRTPKPQGEPAAGSGAGEEEESEAEVHSHPV